MINDGYNFNGNLKELTDNSTLLTKDFIIVANEDLMEKYVISQLSKGSSYLSKSDFPGGISIFSSVRGRFSLVTRNTLGSKKQSDGTFREFVSTRPSILSLLYNKIDKNDLFTNVYNLRNAIEHESDHYFRAFSILENRNKIWNSINEIKLDREIKAIQYQRSTPTWLKTTSDFKKAIQWYWDYNYRKYGN